ncbi:hypothetical protein C8R45DRAFT_1215420 [Mycena sanguinolenta]|nr:hypothetical protein C8R45DRAFT_1215420 [Mycena sanguinolenta]
MSSPFFPLDLEREIFETAAYFYPKTIYNLLLVSHRVYEWYTAYLDAFQYADIDSYSLRIDGMQYATVADEAFEDSCPVDVLLQKIQSESRPASFFHRNVRHLCVAGRRGNWNQDMDVIIQVLSACSGIHNLALSVGPHAHESLPPSRHESLPPWALAALKSRRLTTPVFFLQIDPPTPMFTFLTHLHVPFNPLLATTSRDQLHSFLAHLPALTHFAMGPVLWNILDAGAALAKEILTTCENLDVLVVNMTRTADVKLFPAIDDVRFLLFQHARKAEFIRGWVSETRGGVDFWARADAFVAKKKRGEIQPISRCWIEVRDGIPEEGM